MILTAVADICRLELSISTTVYIYIYKYIYIYLRHNPDSKVLGANMGTTRADRPQVGCWPHVLLSGKSLAKTHGETRDTFLYQDKLFIIASNSQTRICFYKAIAIRIWSAQLPFNKPTASSEVLKATGKGNEIILCFIVGMWPTTLSKCHTLPMVFFLSS